MPKEPFLINRIKSVGFALKGLFILLRTESSIQIQFVIGILVTLAGIYFEISRIEWMFQFVCIGLVMGVEGLNTAIENISAGAVMAVSIISVIVGCMIYIPKIF